LAKGRSRTDWAPQVCLALGVVLLVGGAIFFVHTKRFVAGAERTTGTVIDLSRKTDSEGEVAYYPVVRFTTAEGRTVEFVSSSGSSPASKSEGDRVEVLYDPDDPRDAKLSGFFDLWLFPLAFGALGGIFVFFGLFAPRFGLVADRFKKRPS
jgi:Protein of unknown function (DUF3592)